MKKTIILCTALSSIISSPVFSAVTATEIVYGEDNRVETYEAEEVWQTLAKSTAGMVKLKKVLTVGEYSILPPGELDLNYDLCEGEKFKTQPTAVSCSGFLVGEDMLVTAGHCIKSQKDCDEQAWVFDYKVKESTGLADMMIPSSNIVKCKEIISQKLKGKNQDMRDFALIKLEKKVTGREPLKFRKMGKVSDSAKLVVIGHPSGLPQKVAKDGSIFENDSERFFVTNLDTFGGNSGSAVFNEETKEVEGILVRGAKDYITDETCGGRVNRVGQDAPNEVVIEEVPVVNTSIISDPENRETKQVKKKPYGEAVSRITDIEALMQ